MNFFTILKTFIFLNTYKDTTRNVKWGNLYISFLMTFILILNIVVVVAVIPTLYIFALIATSLYFVLVYKLARKIFFVYMPSFYTQIPNFCLQRYAVYTFSLILCIYSCLTLLYMNPFSLNPLFLTFSLFFILALLWFIVLKRTIRQFFSYLTMLLFSTLVFCILRATGLFFLIPLQSFFDITLLQIILLGIAFYLVILGMVLINFPNVFIKLIIYQYQNTVGGGWAQNLVFFISLFSAISLRVFIFTLLCNVNCTELAISLFVFFLPLRNFLVEFVYFVGDGIISFDATNDNLLLISNIDNELNFLLKSPINVTGNLILYMKGSSAAGGVGTMIGKSIPLAGFSNSRTNVTWPSPQPSFFQQSRRNCFYFVLPQHKLHPVSLKTAPSNHVIYSDLNRTPQPSDTNVKVAVMTSSSSFIDNKAPFPITKGSSDSNITGQPRDQNMSPVHYEVDFQTLQKMNPILTQEAINYESKHKQKLNSALAKTTKATGDIIKDKK